MLAAIGRFFGRTVRAGRTGKPEQSRRNRAGKPQRLRRWAGAKTNRLNKGQWSPVTGKPINADLSMDQRDLWARIAHMRHTSSWVEGIINTHKVDMIGGDGPSLQIQSSNKSYNKKLEDIWNAFWALPDVNGQLTGCDMLALWVDSCWMTGDILVQEVTDPSVDGPVKMRLLTLASQRLGTPPERIGDENVVLGVERTKTGKPIQYWIQDFREGEVGSYRQPTYEPIPAKDIIHEFRMIEPGQARGVPWLAPSLQVIADITSYDEEVMDAARAAADHGLVYYTDHHDAEHTPYNDSYPMERAQVTMAPPTYKPFQIKPEQPATSYKEYRAERLRELGRPVSMPLMLVMLDSGGHNYSSARFDGQAYNRANAALQCWIGRRILNRLLWQIEAEARLAGALPKRPSDVKVHWTWPTPPHVDPAKEAIAERIRLENGTLDPFSAAAAHGLDFEELVRNRKRAADLLADNDLPPGPGSSEVSSGKLVTTKKPDQVTPGSDEAADQEEGDGSESGRSRRRSHSRRAEPHSRITVDLGDGYKSTLNGVN